MISIGRKIKAIRSALRLTQPEFSKPLGVTGAYISALESGGKEPSETLITLLRSHYSINETWWETGEGEMFTGPPPDPTGLQYAPTKSGGNESDEKQVYNILRNKLGWDVEEVIKGLTALPRSARMKILAQMFEAIEEEDERKKREGEG